MTKPSTTQKKIESRIASHNEWIKLKKKLFKKVTWADQEMIGQVTLPRRYGPNIVWTQK